MAECSMESMENAVAAALRKIIHSSEPEPHLRDKVELPALKIIFVCIHGLV